MATGSGLGTPGHVRDALLRLVSPCNSITGNGFGPVQYWSPVTNEGNELCSGQWNTLEGFG